jgi:hypothetical protein
MMTARHPALNAIGPLNANEGSGEKAAIAIVTRALRTVSSLDACDPLPLPAVPAARAIREATEIYTRTFML